MEAKKIVEKPAKMSNSEESVHSLAEMFMELLDKKIHEAKDMLIERFNWIANQPMESAKFMYENNTK